MSFGGVIIQDNPMGCLAVCDLFPRCYIPCRFITGNVSQNLLECPEGLLISH